MLLCLWKDILHGRLIFQVNKIKLRVKNLDEISTAQIENLLSYIHINEPNNTFMGKDR